MKRIPRVLMYQTVIWVRLLFLETSLKWRKKHQEIIIAKRVNRLSIKKLKKKSRMLRTRMRYLRTNQIKFSMF